MKRTFIEKHTVKTRKRLAAGQWFIFVILLTLSCSFLGAGVLPAAARQKSDETGHESFSIDGTTYSIPEPWTGNRIHAPSPAALAFRQVPVEHSANNSSIYIEKGTRQALVKMLEAAEKDGVHLVVESGYRSYQYQKKIFTRLLKSGRTYDDIIRYVAPPGYSQHSLGIAVDFHPSNWEFAELPAYQWLKENSSLFGFTETYPRGNSLGYPWEAWHWAYTPQEPLH